MRPRPVRARSPLATLAVLAITSSAAAQAPYLVKDIDPSLGDRYELAPSSFAEVGGALLFSGCRWNGSSGGNCELWRTDGTAAGTRLVKDILPGQASSTPSALTVIGAQAYFRAAGQTGEQIWK